MNDNIVGSQNISGNEIPTLSTQELVTTVTLRSGETMVLGGLITERANENVTGLPGIRKIPFLGKAFGSTDRSSSREEMLIFIQPHIINGINHQGATPNSLERNRNSVMQEALNFGNPYPPKPATHALPVKADCVKCRGCANCRPTNKRPFVFSRKIQASATAAPIDRPGLFKYKLTSKR